MIILYKLALGLGLVAVSLGDGGHGRNGGAPGYDGGAQEAGSGSNPRSGSWDNSDSGSWDTGDINCDSLNKYLCTKTDLCEWRIFQHSGKCVVHEHENKNETPKNMILLIADGFGINANAAYRLWKKLNSTMTDKYLVGEYSVYGTGQNVADSAAAGTALGSGQIPRNSDVGVDQNRNPVANILYGAKKKGKGVGVVTTAQITDATPAAFTSHSVNRHWKNLIAYQQATRLYGDVDVLFGGGLSDFDGSSNDNLFNITEDFRDLGWNSLSLDKDDLLLLNEEDIPAIGLFFSSQLPDYLARKNIPDFSSVPGLLDMTKKALELLSNRYEDEGFFIMIEAGQPDTGAHLNDVSYLMNEVDEYMNTLDYIMNDFISNRDKDDTLVVMVSDHETGGFSMGRASQWDSDHVIQGVDGAKTVNASTTGPQSIHSFDYDSSIPAPPSLADQVAETSMYQFYTEPLDYATLTAMTLSFVIQDQNCSNPYGCCKAMDAVFEDIEEFYIEQLTEPEKLFITSCCERNPNLFGFIVGDCLSKVLSVRMNAGWTTHAHTASDIRISAHGPGSDKFKGFNGNIQNIGRKLIDIFEVREQIERMNERLKRHFLTDRLKICDETEPIQHHFRYMEGFGVNDSISWPKGNYKYPGFCVEKFLVNNLNIEGVMFD